MLILLLSLVLLLPLCTPYLGVDRGVVVKVGEDLLEGIAAEVAAKAVQQIKELSLSEEIKDGKLTISMWDLRFTELSLDPPNLDLSSPDQSSLLIDAGVSGSLEVVAGWRIKRKTWLGELSIKGGVTLTMNNFNVNTRLSLSEGGDLGLQYETRSCLMDVGQFDVHFTGRTGWLLNLAVKLFRSRLEGMVEEQICEKLREAAREGAEEITQSALRDRYLDFVGHRLVFNNRPWRVTGGKECAIIAVLGEMTAKGLAPPLLTTPFIATTEEPREEEQEEEEQEEEEASGEEEKTRAFTTLYTTSYSSSSYPRGYDKRAVRSVDLCDTIPGGKNAVSVVVTEEMVVRVVENLHRLRLVDYKAVQDRDTPGLFQQYWGGRDIGTLTWSADELREYDVKLHITSATTPLVNISEQGLSLASNLRTRVTVSDDQFTGKLEFYITGDFLAQMQLNFEGGEYRTVPEIQLNVDVDDVRMQLASSKTKMPLGDEVVEQIEEYLEEMLTNKLPKLVKDELRDGFPLNIPDCLELVNARIRYREDYILITASDVRINL